MRRQPPLGHPQLILRRQRPVGIRLVVPLILHRRQSERQAAFHIGRPDAEEFDLLRATVELWLHGVVGWFGVLVVLDTGGRAQSFGEGGRLVITGGSSGFFVATAIVRAGLGV